MTALKPMQYAAEAFNTNQQVAACADAVEQCREHICCSALLVAFSQGGNCLPAVMQ